MINTFELDRRITHPHAGIRMIAPAPVREVLASIKQRTAVIDGQRVHTPLDPSQRTTLWTPELKARIQLMLGNRITARRYPERQIGESFMHEVDTERHIELLGLADRMSDHIVSEWQKIDPQKDIAVVLFGSVATGLVKSRLHPDPSNVDLAVVGDFNQEATTSLLNAIKSERTAIGEEIRSTCPNVDRTLDPLPGNVGVFVQRPQILTNDHFGEARVYLASGAYALHDPAGIWAEIDRGAIEYQAAVLAKRAAHTHKGQR